MKRLLFLLVILVMGWPAYAQVTPVDPTAPTTFTPTFAASALSTVNVTSGSGSDFKTQIEAVTTCGTYVVAPVTSYTIAAPITLPAVAGTCVGSAAGVSAISGSSGVHAIAGSSGAAATMATGDNYITIISANSASLPAYGSTVGPSDKTNMPTLIGPANASLFVCQNTSHHIRLVGFNMQAPAGQSVDSFVLCQVPATTTTGQDVHDIVIDRNYATGDATAGAIQGLQLGGKNMAIVGNRITNITDTVRTAETHGILMATGSGPYLIRQNEVCSTSAGIFVGDSFPDNWTGGSAGVGTAILQSDGTITNNWIHKVCVSAGAYASSKNLFEIKGGQRWNLDGNIFELSPVGNQTQCINLASPRGSKAGVTDISFTNNWVKNCAIGATLALRPTCAANGCGGAITAVVTDGSTNCGGGACAKITVSDCGCTVGDTIEIDSMTGSGGTWSTLNGTWRITSLPDRQHMIVNRAFPGGTWSTGSYTVWHQAISPVQRIKIVNNYFMDLASNAMSAATLRSAIQINTNPVVNPSGGTDGALSGTGDWKPNDLNISYNTFANPTASDWLKDWIEFVEPGALTSIPYASVWQGDRWTIRNNMVRITNVGGGSVSYAVTYSYGVGGVFGFGTAGLTRTSTASGVGVTRDFSHNVGWNSGFADEATKYTGSDSWITSSTGNCATIPILVNCTATTLAGAALQASSPGHNASTDLTDVGANMTTLAAALATVPQ